MSEPHRQIFEFGEFQVDAYKRLLKAKTGETLPLTPKVFELLLFLLRHNGKVVEKDELMSSIWPDTIVEESNLSQNISILRRILGETPGEHRFIVTVPGVGYKFVAEVREKEESTVLELGDIAVLEPPKSFDKLNDANDQPINRQENIEGRRKDGESKKINRVLFFGLLAISVIVLGFIGFYVASENAKTAADPPIKNIAVLPFKPLVEENRDESLELGMADALISKLSGGEEIAVRPLSAIRRFNSMELDSIAAGRELGVDSVLDGSIQTWGERIRVSAKLLRTSDGKQLWAGQFDEKFNDIFAVQDSISEKVAAALKIQLGSREKKRQTENVEAYQLYMKGRYHLSKLTPSNIRASVPYFQQAIEIDPSYALAYTGLARANVVLAISGEMPASEAFPRAKAAGQRAIEIDDTLAEAHVARCMNLFWYDWEWSAAESECRRAVELDSNNADPHGNYAQVLSNTGRHNEALAESKRSLELDPLGLPMNALYGQYLLHAGKPDEALAQLQKTSELEPNFWMPHFFAASAYVEKGMFAEAIAESDTEKELSGGNVIPFGGYALAKSGRRAEARAVLDNLLKLSTGKYVPPYNIALIYNGLGESDKALDWLEKAYEQRDPKMTFLKVESKWNNLRNEPRFVALMKKMNF
ncbi:MAG: winged helix-turn-helix domain-containing tetratricopeptide repeat protein [Pyrinomonadaceae bacterium]